MTTHKYVASVDPGIDGALTLCDLQSREIRVFAMADVRAHQSRFSFLEKQGVSCLHVESIPLIDSSPAPLLMDFGAWVECGNTLGNDHVLIPPKVWQRTCKCPTGLTYDQRKSWLFNRSKELYPGIPHLKDEADAILIMHHVLKRLYR